MKVFYPPPFSLKVIKNEAEGGCAKNVDLVVPSMLSPSQPFILKISLLDEDGIPVVSDGEKLNIKLTETGLNININFFHGAPALAQVELLAPEKENIYRFKTEFDGKIFYSNPCVCRKDNNMNIYWGDPHLHTVLSNCHANLARSLNFCFNAARYVSALDWCSAADHVSNGRCELARWKEQVAGANAYNYPGEFVTLPAYEASLRSGQGGDNNVYFDKFPSLFVDNYAEGNTKTLCNILAKLRSTEQFSFFVVPHHTTRADKHGEISDDIYPGENLLPVMEIHSKWGTSEYRGNPHALKEIHPGMSYATDFLNRGLKIGFIGGTDSHATLTFSAGKHEPPHIDRLPGLTAVWAEKLDRDSIFQGIKHRHCYAVSGERIYLDFKVNGVGMGQSKPLRKKDIRKREISLEAAGKSDIKSVEIVRNGKVIAKFSPDDWCISESVNDTESIHDLWRKSKSCKFLYYYVRIRCHSGASAWSSPIWFIEP